MDPEDELLTVDGAARLLDVSHMNQGRLPKRKLGREYVLYKSDLKKLDRPDMGRPRRTRPTPPP
jgi:hypothetical protein